MTIALAIALIAAAAGAAWVGYQVYVEHSRDAEVEHQLGVEEQARLNAAKTVDDVIVELDQTPTFNGPTAPLLDLGPGTTQP